MSSCCPPNRGCNGHGAEQPCVLTIFRAAATTNDEAALALERWKALELTEEEGAGAGERRFRRRAYERARDRALTVAAMDLAAEIPSGQPTVRRRSRRARTARAAGGRRGRASPVRTVNA
jgi:hypothetical protein